MISAAFPSALLTPYNDARSRIDSMIGVAGADTLGRFGPHSPYVDWLAIAPAYLVYEAAFEESLAVSSLGNSQATAIMAGIIAYWRGLLDIKNR